MMDVVGRTRGVVKQSGLELDPHDQARPTLPDSKHGQQTAARNMEERGLSRTKGKRTVMNSPTLGWIFIR
jgi:hypothetical protein